MAGYDEVCAELKGRTGTSGEIEEELIRRVAIVETAGEVVSGLTKRDWNITWFLMLALGLVPLVIYAFLLGIEP